MFPPLAGAPNWAVSSFLRSSSGGHNAYFCYWSAFTHILPNMEYRGVEDALRQGVAGYEANPDFMYPVFNESAVSTTGWRAISRRLAEVECPSDPVLSQIGTSNRFSSNIKFNGGDVIVDVQRGSPQSANAAAVASTQARFRGPLLGAAFEPTSARTLVRNPVGGPSTIARITDGTSKTMLLSEQNRLSRSANDTRGGMRASVTGWAGGTYPNNDRLTVAPNTCAASTASWDTSTFTDNWGDNNGATFFAVQPPNGARCSNRTGTRAHLPASSYHPGGVNVAMCDGSVRFVRDDIDAGDQSVAPSPASGSGYLERTGPSQWGVWGALATAASGEQANLE